MAAFERYILEEIAADLLRISAEYVNTPYKELLTVAQNLSDIELVNFICK